MTTLETLIRKTLAPITLSLGLTLGITHCGPDDPTDKPDSGVCCADAGTAQDSGSSDAGGSDAGNPDAGPSDANDTDSGPCTTTPTVQYVLSQNLTPIADGGPNSYKANAGEQITVDACATTDADRYKIEWSDTPTDFTLNCQGNKTYAPGNYTVNIKAFNDTCNTNATETLNVLVEQANQPPVAMAGPDMTIKKNKTYCFNFSDNNTNFFLRCGSATLAPGHSASGTGSYDPDGSIQYYGVFQDKDNYPNVEFQALDGKILLSENTTGTKRLVLEATDNKGDTRTDEAVVTVIE